MLAMSAVDMAAPDGQSVEVTANGTILGEAQVLAGTPQTFTFAVPDAALEPSDLLDVELRFPNAILVNSQDTNTRKRSIKLTAVRVGPTATSPF